MAILHRRIVACALTLLACGPVVNVETGSDTGTTLATKDPSTNTTDGVGSLATSESTGDDRPALRGECFAPCVEPVDCCVLVGNGPECPNAYPDAYTCEGGFCRDSGCGSDDDCSSDGFLCVASDGAPECHASCVNDADCAETFPYNSFACNGTYCVPGPCESFYDCGGGSCSDAGLCLYGCGYDRDCNGMGLCDYDTRTCGCASDADCLPGHTCVVE